MDDTAEAVQEGVDQAADVTQEVTGQVADGQFQHLAAFSDYNQITHTQARHCLTSDLCCPQTKHSTNSALWQHMTFE